MIEHSAIAIALAPQVHVVINPKIAVDSFSALRFRKAISMPDKAYSSNCFRNSITHSNHLLNITIHEQAAWNIARFTLVKVSDIQRFQEGFQVAKINVFYPHIDITSVFIV